MSKTIRENAKKSLSGMMISVFILHIMLMLYSLKKGEFVMVFSMAIPGSPLQNYFIQFVLACITGALFPILTPLVNEDVPHYRIRLFFNMFLSFVIYYAWLTFIFGAATHVKFFYHLLIFLVFIGTDFWAIVGIQHFLLKRKILAMNAKLSDMENTFLRDDHVKLNNWTDMRINK